MRYDTNGGGDGGSGSVGRGGGGGGGSSHCRKSSYQRWGMGYGVSYYNTVLIVALLFLGPFVLLCLQSSSGERPSKKWCSPPFVVCALYRTLELPLQYTHNIGGKLLEII